MLIYRIQWHYTSKQLSLVPYNLSHNELTVLIPGTHSANTVLSALHMHMNTAFAIDVSALLTALKKQIPPVIQVNPTLWCILSLDTWTRVSTCEPQFPHL